MTLTMVFKLFNKEAMVFRLSGCRLIECCGSTVVELLITLLSIDEDGLIVVDAIVDGDFTLLVM